MSLFAELKRRNVFRVGVAYIVGGWLIAQVMQVATESFEAPAWIMKMLITVLVIGLPITLFISWAYEITPEGIKRESSVSREESITNRTARKLDLLTITLLAVVALMVVADRFVIERPGTPPTTPPQVAEESTSPAKASISEDANSIAVLPFANRSRLEDDAFFTDGIHDDLLTQLAKIGGIKVISRTSVMQYRDTTQPIAEIAAELGVSRILEGGVQRAGDRVRINAQLIDVTNDQHVWAESYDREMTVENLFEIQSEIARHIVQAVRGELTAEETQALAQVPTDSLAAYEAYLQAKAEIYRPEYAMDKYIRAGEWLQQALTADPEFGLAWATLVLVHAQYIWHGDDDSPGRLERMQDALANAERFAPGQPETLAARADYLYRIQSDYPAAEALLEAAVQAKPGDSLLLIQLAMAERRAHQFDQAIQHLEAAADRDPANLSAQVLLAETLIRTRRYSQAEPVVDRNLRDNTEALSFSLAKARILLFRDGDAVAARALVDSMAPWAGFAYETTTLWVYSAQRDFQGIIDLWTRPPLSAYRDMQGLQPYFHVTLANAYRHLGDEQQAIKHARQVIKFARVNSSVSVVGQVARLEMLALAHSYLGEFPEALAAAEEVVTLRNDTVDSYEGLVTSQVRAQVLGLAGRNDEALAELARLMSLPTGPSPWQVHLNPAWDFLRDDPRFLALTASRSEPESMP